MRGSLLGGMEDILHQLISLSHYSQGFCCGKRWKFHGFNPPCPTFGSSRFTGFNPNPDARPTKIQRLLRGFLKGRSWEFRWEMTVLPDIFFPKKGFLILGHQPKQWKITREISENHVAVFDLRKKGNWMTLGWVTWAKAVTRVLESVNFW